MGRHPPVRRIGGLLELFGRFVSADLFPLYSPKRGRDPPKQTRGRSPLYATCISTSDRGAEPGSPAALPSVFRHCWYHGLPAARKSAAARRPPSAESIHGIGPKRRDRIAQARRGWQYSTVSLCHEHCWKFLAIWARATGGVIVVPR
jgi:hypothetical protein